MSYGDLTNSKWDLKNCGFFIRSCALAYENPQGLVFNQVVNGWDIPFTRTAARESANAHVWGFTKNKTGFIILTFKGTSPFNWNEWLTDATANPVGAQKIVGDDDSATVHQGFYEALWGNNSKHWLHITHQLNSACQDFPDDIEKIHVWVTGHSLGAATATLATCRLLLHPEDISDERAELRGSYTFGTPRVGNKDFIEIVTHTLASRKNCTMHRVINANDIITMIPFEDPEGTYLHFGEAHYLTLKGEIIHCGDKCRDPWGEFLRFRGSNLWYTIIQQVRALMTLPFQFGLQSFYNALFRLFVPFFLFDHSPSQYIDHLLKDTNPGYQ